MRWTVVALVAAALAVLGLAAPAQAASWTSQRCSTAWTNGPVTVCTQVRYLSSGSSRLPYQVYVYWYGSGTAYNLDDVRLYQTYWNWTGTNFANYRVYGIAGQWKATTRCYIEFDVDGPGWSNAYDVRHWHRCY